MWRIRAEGAFYVIAGDRGEDYVKGLAYLIEQLRCLEKVEVFVGPVGEKIKLISDVKRSKGSKEKV